MFHYGIVSETDLNEVAELEKSIFPQPWCLKVLKEEYNQWCFIGICARNEMSKLVGYLLGRFFSDEAEILRIAVANQYRHMHIAITMLQSFVEHLKRKNTHHIYLEVDENNTCARLCYEKFGFILHTTRFSYYPNGNNALVYYYHID